MKGSGTTGARFAVNGRETCAKRWCQGPVQEPLQDPVALLLKQISSAETVDDVENLIFKKRASAPFKTSEQVYTVVWSWIEAALTCTDSVKSVSNDIDSTCA